MGSSISPDELWQASTALLGAANAAAPRQTRQHFTGDHKRRRAGSGENFWQYRQMQSGEPAAAIDWRRSARSDLLYTRQNEHQSRDFLCLWVDCANSMNYGQPRSKYAHAAILALALARFYAEAHDPVRCLQPLIKSVDSRNLDRLTLELATPTPSTAQMPAARSARLVYISDCLTPFEILQKQLTQLCATGAHPIIIQLLDISEVDYDLNGRMLLHDRPENRLLLEKAEALKDPYQEALSALQSQLQQLAIGLNGQFFSATGRTLPDAFRFCLEASHA